MKKITMRATAAGPNFILLEGKSYVVENDVAEAMMAAGSATIEGAAAAVPAKKGVKVLKPGKPDPGEKELTSDTYEEDEDDDDDTGSDA